jgi:hypothetical protein
MGIAVDYLYQIPPITDLELSKPGIEKILLNKTHAIMPRDIFDELEEFPWYFPGHPNKIYCYPGRIWKHKDGKDWYFCWFGEHKDPKLVSNHYRKIIVL